MLFRLLEHEFIDENVSTCRIPFQGEVPGAVLEPWYRFIRDFRSTGTETGSLSCMMPKLCLEGKGLDHIPVLFSLE